MFFQSVLPFVKVKLIANDELGSWCLNGLWGAKRKVLRGGIHGNPGGGNHPLEQLQTGTVTLNMVQWRYLPMRILTQEMPC